MPVPSVLIIGAGISGLYAGHLLNSYGVPVVVVEASGQVGGRVREDSDFIDWNIELGGEYIHGTNHILKRLADKLGLSTANIFEVFDVRLAVSWLPFPSPLSNRLLFV